MSSINIRSKRLNDKTQLRILIAHPMQHTEPAQFIRLLTVTWNKKVVLSCELGVSTPPNPYFAFVLKNAHAGDKITVSWLDNLGHTDSEHHTIH